MKRLRFVLFTIIALVSILALAAPAMAGPPEGAKIQDGTILASNGDVITVGYDQYGYNYQARLFNGRYCDYDRVIGGPYEDVTLVMKWNDAWLSNMDRDGDNKLDRHYGYTSYIGSGAWCTNHQYGVNPDGSRWEYFVKIAAVPTFAVKLNGIWYTANEDEIGPDTWGQFAIVQEVVNDPAAGQFGVQYKSPIGPGLGKF